MTWVSDVRKKKARFSVPFSTRLTPLSCCAKNWHLNSSHTQPQHNTSPAFNQRKQKDKPKDTHIISHNGYPFVLSFSVKLPCFISRQRIQAHNSRTAATSAYSPNSRTPTRSSRCKGVPTFTARSRQSWPMSYRSCTRASAGRASLGDSQPGTDMDCSCPLRRRIKSSSIFETHYPTR